MKTKGIAICVSNDNSCSFYETINAIKKAGFKNVFIQLYHEEWTPSEDEQLKYIKDLGLNIIFAHLEYKHINDIWLDDEKGDEALKIYKDDILNCHNNDINLVVMHLTAHKVAPNYSAVGLKRINELNEYAKTLGVRIAFENTKIRGYQEYVAKNILDNNIGFCLDTGHNHAHFNDELNLDLFKNRIYALHLHDNHGNDIDEHLIPFDGSVDWNYITSKLRENKYQEYITLESVYAEHYKNISVDEFYKKCYDSALKINDMINKKED